MKTKRKKPKHGRLYVILKRDTEGRILGYTEHSWSMSWQLDQCRVWREWELNYYTKKFSDERYKELEDWLPKDDGVFLARLNSKNCPITVVMPKGVDTMSKTPWRNQSFTVK